MAKQPRLSRNDLPRVNAEVYTSGHAKSWIWNAIPGPLTTLYSLVMAGSVSGLAYMAGDKWGPGKGTQWSMISIGIMTVIMGAIGVVRARKAKREAASQGEGLDEALRQSGNTMAADEADPAETARIDDLRKNFQRGIDTFREYGKDMYEMPWYVIVGEPGSGKTEAIRRSDLRFPERLQDKLQGTGGTYSMHWWFTNHAIILDTAGAMLINPEAAERFEEFLQLLRQHRAECPINGMILTIPVDSLLKNTPHEADEKAVTIAEQLSIIQKALDVRFPIYLMISKSDLLPGFREFFNAPGQQAFEREIMGWSNPYPLDVPFQRDHVTEALGTLSYRLRQRALGLLADPRPRSQTPKARRIDEVDALYTFPETILSLEERLARYLGVLFQSGAWASKTPFFRGIYFTSALSEGAQLDAHLAKALGTSLDRLAPVGIFQKEKSVFLRDLFLEKIFRERGLVTRLKDVASILKKRLLGFYGATAALLAFMSGMFWLVKSKIDDQLTSEQDRWAAVNSTWENGTLLPIVIKQTGERPAWKWAGASTTTFKEQSRIKLLEELNHQTESSLRFSWVFWPIPQWREFEQRRRDAYLTTFEGSVIKPLLDSTRERFYWDTAQGNQVTPQTQEKMVKAYMALLTLETWLEKEKVPTKEDWEGLFSSLLDYTLAPETPGGMVEAAQPQAASPPPAQALIHDKEDVSRIAQLASAIYTEKPSKRSVTLKDRKWMSEGTLPFQKDRPGLLVAAEGIFGKTATESQFTDLAKQEIKRDVEEKAKEFDEIVAKINSDGKSFEEQKALDSSWVAYCDFLKQMETLIREADQRQGATAAMASAVDQKLLDQASELTRNTKLPDTLRSVVSAVPRSASSVGSTFESQPSMSWQGRRATAKRMRELLTIKSQLNSTLIGFGTASPIGRLIATLAKATELKPTSPSSTATIKESEKAQTQDGINESLLKAVSGSHLIEETIRQYRWRVLIHLNAKLDFPYLSDRFEDPTSKFNSSTSDLVSLEEELTKALESVTDGGGELQKLRSDLQPLFDLRKAFRPTEGANALKVEVDGIPEPSSVTRIEGDPEPQPQDQSLMNKLNPLAQPPIPTQPRNHTQKQIKTGITGGILSINGTNKNLTPGQPTTADYNGRSKVEVALKLAKESTDAGQARIGWNSEWQFLRTLINQRRQAVPIPNGGGATIGIKADRDLPWDDWPTARSLGLPPAKVLPQDTP